MMRSIVFGFCSKITKVRQTTLFPASAPTVREKIKSPQSLSQQRIAGLYFLVRLARFERTTHGLEDRCSIQLSYKREGGRGDRI